MALADLTVVLQKKRKYGQDQREDREEEAKKAAAEDELLKDATTLYVGNLWVGIDLICCDTNLYLAHSTPPKNRFMSSSPSAARSND